MSGTTRPQTEYRVVEKRWNRSSPDFSDRTNTLRSPGWCGPRPYEPCGEHHPHDHPAVVEFPVRQLLQEAPFRVIRAYAGALLISLPRLSLALVYE